MAVESDQINIRESKRVAPTNTWILMANMKLAYTILRRPNGTFNRPLAEFLDRKLPANVNPIDGVFSFDIIVHKSLNLISRIYKPVELEPNRPYITRLDKPLSRSQIVPVIIFFHGGSFVHSSANSALYDVFCRRLVGRCKAVVVSVNYRRAPENPYPSAYDDGWTALEWVNSRAWLKSKKSKVYIYLAGDCCGGNIVHHVGLRAAKSGIEVFGNVLLSPMFGGETRTESEKHLGAQGNKSFVTIQEKDWYWKAFLPEGEDRDHPACNPFGPRGLTLERVKFPKTLVVVAGLDLISDSQLTYVDGLKRADQEVKLLFLENATAGFYFLTDNDHFHMVMDEISEFVKPVPRTSALCCTCLAPFYRCGTRIERYISDIFKKSVM